LHRDPYSVDTLNSSQSKDIGGVLINLASEDSLSRFFLPSTHRHPLCCTTQTPKTIRLETAMPSGSKSKSRGNRLNRTGNLKPTLNSIYASYGGFEHFLHTFGLKPYNTDEVEEGRKIAQVMLENDLMDWEEGKNT